MLGVKAVVAEGEVLAEVPPTALGAGPGGDGGHLGQVEEEAHLDGLQQLRVVGAPLVLDARPAVALPGRERSELEQAPGAVIAFVPG